MNETIHLECGPADDAGRRLVLARYGAVEHRDSFQTDDASRRQRFAEAALERFGWALMPDTIADIDAKIAQLAGNADTRQTVPTGSNADHVYLVNVPAAQVDWLWPGRIAIGKVTLIAGDPGIGKSFVTLDMAARVSTGAEWPEVGGRQGDTERGRQGESWLEPSDSRASSSLSPNLPLSLSWSPSDTGVIRRPGSVVLLSAEDDLADTIRPRLEAAGADCSRIAAIRAITGSDEEGDYRRTFEIGRDLSHLTAIIEEMQNCRLVVIDPISAYLGRTGENLNAEVRALIGPLAELASRYQLAVVAVTHLRKGDGAAIYRAMGSMAFVAAARGAWMNTKDPQQPGRRLFLPMKNNLSSDATGLAYTIESRSGDAIVQWSDEEVQGGAELMQANGRPATERNEIMAWLKQLLAAGPVRSTEVQDAALGSGFSWATVRRAFRRIGGKSVKQGTGWSWRLADSAGTGLVGADFKSTQQGAPKSVSEVMSILTPSDGPTPDVPLANCAAVEF